MENIKLSVKSFACASSIIWASGVLMVGVISLLKPGYGSAFLGLLSSVYPFYDGQASIASIAKVTLCALFDGAIFGILFAVLYNVCLRCSCCCSSKKNKN